MSRYWCEKKKQEVKTGKVDRVCLIKRCPKLVAKLWEKHLKKFIYVPVVPRDMIEEECKDGR